MEQCEPTVMGHRMAMREGMEIRGDNRKSRLFMI
jgi:hypothetical protein